MAGDGAVSRLRTGGGVPDAGEAGLDPHAEALPQRVRGVALALVVGMIPAEWLPTSRPDHPAARMSSAARAASPRMVLLL